MIDGLGIDHSHTIDLGEGSWVYPSPTTATAPYVQTMAGFPTGSSGAAVCLRFGHRAQRGRRPLNPVSVAMTPEAAEALIEDLRDAARCARRSNETGPR